MQPLVSNLRNRKRIESPLVDLAFRNLMGSDGVRGGSKDSATLFGITSLPTALTESEWESCFENRYSKPLTSGSSLSSSVCPGVPNNGCVEWFLVSSQPDFRFRCDSSPSPTFPVSAHMNSAYSSFLWQSQGAAMSHSSCAQADSSAMTHRFEVYGRTDEQEGDNSLTRFR